MVGEFGRSDSFAFLQRFGGAGEVAGQARCRDCPTLWRLLLVGW